jgi:hypothetical protein
VSGVEDSKLSKMSHRSTMAKCKCMSSTPCQAEEPLNQPTTCLYDDIFNNLVKLPDLPALWWR